MEKQRRWPRRLKLQQLVQIIGRPTRATDTTSSWESWRDTTDSSTDTINRQFDRHNRLDSQTERKTHALEKLKSYQWLEG